MTTLDDLISPETEDEALSYYLTEMANPEVGFPTTSWQSGGVAYTILRIVAKKTVDLVTLVASIAKGGLLDLSTGAWLTLLAKHIFRLDRYPATFAKGKVRLFIAPGFSGQTIQPGQLWIKTPSGKRYNSRNTTPVTIATGGSDVRDFQAESPGASYNVAVGTALTLVTPLPGLTASFEDLGGATWLTTQGADEEKDPELRTRCRSKWATLGIQKTKDAYVQLAMDTPGLGTQPNRVYIDTNNPRGPGSIDIWLAGPSGPLPGSDVSLISAYITDRKSPSANLQISAAIPRPITINGTYYYQGVFSDAPSQAVDNLTAMINALPLGGKLYRSQAIEEIMDPDGAVDVTNLTINGSSTADLALAANEVATVNVITLTPVVSNP